MGSQQARAVQKMRLDPVVQASDRPDKGVEAARKGPDEKSEGRLEESADAVQECHDAPWVIASRL
jgi:hypothetical protein